MYDEYGDPVMDKKTEVYESIENAASFEKRCEEFDEKMEELVRATAVPIRMATHDWEYRPDRTARDRLLKVYKQAQAEKKMKQMQI